jgi:hypothetical protein
MPLEGHDASMNSLSPKAICLPDELTFSLGDMSERF